MAIVYGANYGRPTLDLNFAKNKSLIDTLTGRNLITFSRSSTATYVGADGLIKYAASNAARFDHNPATGESLGLLVEEARTNVATYSDQLANAIWTKAGLSIFTVNTITAPDGTLTGSFIAWQNATSPLSNGLGLQYGVGIAAGTNTLSCFAKIGTARYLALGLTNNSGLTSTAIFDLQTGTVNGSGSHPNFTVNGTSMVSAGAGWYRCSLTSTYAATMKIHISSSTSGFSGTYGRNVSGDGTSGIYIWGPQIEPGSFPTSYIPTVASTVTRAADVASITGTNFSSWYNVNQGTTFFATLLQTPVANFSHGFLSQENGNQFRCGIYNNEWVAWRTGEGIGPRSPIVSGINKGAFCYDRITSTQSRCFNSTTPTNATYSIPLSPTSVPIVYQPGSVRISRIAYYPTRLQDFQLQQLTK